MFQSPIGWGLSCEVDTPQDSSYHSGVSIPYWLGSKLRVCAGVKFTLLRALFQSPIGWGLSCEVEGMVKRDLVWRRFNPLLVGV